ncbi:MAG TPA: class I SAM-dependent methyltransferase [Bryobacteraceae bacterium]
MAPAALEAIVQRGPFQRTAETGCGGSTIVLSHASAQHTAFAVEGQDRTISELRKHTDLLAARVQFVDGETKQTLPRHEWQGDLDLVLLDGPHAYPLPQLEFTYLFPRIKTGGWLAIDDIQIPSVYELFEFLQKEPCVALEDVKVRTAFFRKISAAKPELDGWASQGMNRHTILRYSWRDRVRRLVKR